MKSLVELQGSWKEKDQWLNQYFEEIESYDFYRFLFPEGSFQNEGDYGHGNPNGFMITLDENNKPKSKMVFDDLLLIEKTIEDYPTVFMSPISYFGRTNTLSNARYAYALTFDIDYVTFINLQNIIHQATKIDYIPVPTFIVNSGTGVHLYYIFEEPIPLFYTNQVLLKEMKKRLTEKIWNADTSSSKYKQFQGITQGFRNIGSQTKLGKDYRVKAFWVGLGERVTLEYLNGFLVLAGGTDRRIKLNDFKRDGQLSLDQAKEKYPEWYQKRIVEKKKHGSWTCNEALYEWWKQKIKEEISVGHRYHSIVALVAYAEKCGIEYDRVERDAYAMIGMLDAKSIEADNHFTSDDVGSALKLYEEDKLDGKTAVHYTREYISQMTGVHIPPNKRNGRTQKEHMKIVNFARELDHPNGLWRNKDGRPSKEKLVKEYLKYHPTQNPTQIAKALGMSRTTVYKYI